MYCSGVLVEAMRKGYWIILDELNLAPTDVLEALNRVSYSVVSCVVYSSCLIFLNDICQIVIVCWCVFRIMDLGLITPSQVKCHICMHNA